MTIEKVKHLLESFKLIVVGNVGNLFEIKFLHEEIEGTGDTYKIHIPLLTKRNTLSYNNIDELSNPILAVLPRKKHFHQLKLGT